MACTGGQLRINSINMLHLRSRVSLLTGLDACNAVTVRPTGSSLLNTVEDTEDSKPKNGRR